MANLHPTLRPKFNLLLVCVELIIAAILLMTIKPAPISFACLGILAGIFGGIFQWSSFNESGDLFLNAGTMIEVRKALNNTKWGKVYLCYFWIFNIGMFLLATYLKSNAFLNFFTAYFSFAFARDIVTLYPVFQLEAKLRNK